jgi:hypothetical protein
VGATGPELGRDGSWAAACAGWRWAARERNRRRTAGLRRLGPKTKTGQNRGRGKREKEKGFQIFKNKQPNEFKHSNIMLQHVCNNKPLRLIYFILKIIKCLK